MKKILQLFSITALLIAATFQTSNAQSEPQRLAFGFNYGLVKYWGEFTDNQFWWGGDVFLRYNILSELSVQATFGLANIRYKTNEEAINKYPEYFDLYPGSGVDINDKNSIRLNTYEVYLTYNFFPKEPFVPYLFVGAGLLNFEPRSGDTGYDGALPNNIAGEYDKTKFVVPFGIGFESYITDNLVINGRGTLRWTGTDYLDDFAQEGTADDIFVTFGAGISYYILGDPDWDNDGLTNGEEVKLGTDPKNPDTDGDKLLDGEEVKTHHSNPLKQDTDGDNLIDYAEVMVHKTSPIKADSDSDNLDDGQEIARKTDPLNSDSDGDRLLDGDEVAQYKTDPLDKDTDGDTLTDGDEVLKYNSNPKAADSDNDGLSDGEEVNTYKTKPAVADSDNDGLTDGMEIKTYKTDPNNPDSDGDGLTDGSEVNEHGSDPKIVDTDADGLNDGEEVRRHKTNPVSVDTDADGLTDGDEVLTYKTNPLDVDSDQDQLKDGEEVNKYKTNPTLRDSDNDLLADGREVLETNTDPANPDTDGDGVIDGKDDCPLVAGVESTEAGQNGCPEAPKIGTKVDFPDILFKVDSDEFNYDFPGTARNLAKLLEYIRQCENLQVMIEGHASSEGADDYNQKLSERRAKKVREWLVEQGVAQDKIAGFIGYGEKQPKVAEPTGADLKKISAKELEEIRKQNRRITIEVTRTCDTKKK